MLVDTLRRVDLRAVLTTALIAVLCANFWLGSRYPSLQGKASADPNEALSTPLGFEQHFPEPLPDQKLQHVLWSAAEWAVTNRQGMTFGLLLAAGLLTLLPLLPRVRSGKLLGAVHGVVIGTPLGVCVNCAAPIGQSMLRGGARVETALATMFASPSFNVIVLGMLFTMFPLHLALIKVAASAIMVLVGVPLLARLAERPGWRKPPQLAAAQPAPALPGLRAFQWLQRKLDASSRAHAELDEDRVRRRPLAALGWLAVNYPRNLWIVVRLALPLMLLAGLLGAAMAELLPWTRIVALAQVEGWVLNGLVLLLLSIFGTLLPIPIAFDIVIASVLWAAGVPPYVVAALLVTLGLYSIYPWSLVGTTLSWRIAAVAGAMVCALGVAGGAAAQVLGQWHEIRQARATAALLDEIGAPAPAPDFIAQGRDAQALRAGSAPRPGFAALPAPDGLSLLHAPFLAPTAAGADTPFTRIDGAAAGFERLPLPRPYLGMEPTTMHLGALAAGDFNDDGWPDLAMGSYHGVFLYANLGGQFAQQAIDFPAMRDWIIGDVALVDLDGDGALDLFFSAWMQGSHILFNRGGAFSAAAHLALPRHTETLVAASAFADLDRDGDLDIVTGGTTFAAWFFYPEIAVNHVWRNDGAGGFTPEPLAAAPQGDTLALLITDFDDDGWPDLMVGNDFDEPDRVYRNVAGRLEPLTAAQGPLPYSTTTTMSLDTGDLDNDGDAELYVTQIAMGSMSGLQRRLALPHRSCDINADVADRSRCDDMAGFQIAVVRARNIEDIDICRELADPVQQRDCAVTAYHWNRIIVRLPVLGAGKEGVLAECAQIPADFTTMHDLCAAMAQSPMDNNRTAANYPEELEQLAHTNLLWRADDSGYRDATDVWGASFGGWSWNGKFADLDNDGWQDLFVAQGSRLRASGAHGVFYRNAGGTRFEESTAAFGLKDHRPTGAWLHLDYDGDGDLDLITYPFLLTPAIWRNDAPAGAAIEIALEDGTSPGNRSAVGARVELLHADGMVQMRQIKASGGYQSHDLMRAHFGLGALAPVDALRITWPDGSTQTLDAPAPGPGRYRVLRGTGD